MMFHVSNDDGRFFLMNTISIAVALLVVLSGSSLFAQRPGNPNVIQLKFKSAQISLDHRLVTIADVADIKGGNQQIRRLVGDKDLDELENLQTSTITGTLVQTRLMLAGFKSQNLQIDRGSSIQVRYVEQEDLQRRVESKLESELAQQFGISLADVQINVTAKAHLDQIAKAIDISDFSLMAVFPTKLPLGNKTIQVELVDQQGQRFSTRINVQIVVMKEMVVTASAVPRGTVITAGHVQTVKRPMVNGNIDPVSLDCVGCTASRDIPPHEIVSSRYVTRKKAKDQIAIRQNALVNIQLVVGPVNIHIRNAKALSAGAVGDTILVLNPDSGKRINAVVKNASTVVVQQR